MTDVMLNLEFLQDFPRSKPTLALCVKRLWSLEDHLAHLFLRCTHLWLLSLPGRPPTRDEEFRATVSALLHMRDY